MILSSDTHTYISASVGSHVYIRSGNNDSTNQLIVATNATGLTWRGNTVWTAENDGTGSGLDADVLDGLQASSFLRSDTADTASGDITFSGGAGAVTVAAASDIRIAGGTWTGEYTGGIKIQSDGSNSYIPHKGTLFFRDEGSTNNFQLTQRKEFNYPPFSKLIKIRFKSKKIDIIDSSSKWFGDAVNNLINCTVLYF